MHKEKMAHILERLRRIYKDGPLAEKTAAVSVAAAGVQAAKSSGMRCIGIGDQSLLQGADLILSSTQELLSVFQ